MRDTVVSMSDPASAAAAALRSAADPTDSREAAVVARAPLSAVWVVLLVAAIAIALQIRIPDLR
jgi:hypothetical protein